MNPEVELWDEDEEGNPEPWTPEPTAMQRYLWRTHLEEDLNSVKKLANGAPMVIVHHGDPCQGDKYLRQLVSTRRADQIRIAVANFAPWLAMPNVSAVRVVQGTAAHGFSEGTAEMLITDQLKVLHPNLDVKTVRHNLLNVGGVRIDCAHHGPSAGIREWTDGNQLRYYLRSLMYRDILRGTEPPHIVFRGHYHGFNWETVRINADGRTWESHIVLLPAYCGMGEYGQQATRSSTFVRCGVVAVEIEDGNFTIHPFWREVDLRTEETL